MTKLKQGDEFTDKKGNEYRYKYRNGILNVFSTTLLKYGVADIHITNDALDELIKTGELIPVKPKTAADDMLEWLEGLKRSNLDMISASTVITQLKIYIAKHEEKQ